MTMSRNPKTVLITGASSGIGEATALRLASDGHRLFLGARRTERLEAVVERIGGAAGGAASFRRLDVTDAEDVRRFVADATDTYGGADVMINNAGVMPLSALAEDKVDEWNQMIDVNIRGVLHGISAALPVMQAQGSGHIINVASVNSRIPSLHAAAYVAEFHRQLSGVVTEEHYVQDVRLPPIASVRGGGVPGVPRRTLLSDLLLVKPIGVDRYVESVASLYDRLLLRESA